MSETHTLAPPRTPTVYFIDDSATMREVIKIAFRNENIQVITCPDAATALAQFGDAAPDAVITDVIMPDRDGYEVCQFIKEHEQFGKTPVILMSGVVNRTVAERAMAVKADELIRKPFQPHDLIVRVKNLLYPKGESTTEAEPAAVSAGTAAAEREVPAPVHSLAGQTLAGLFGGDAPGATAAHAPAAAASPRQQVSSPAAAAHRPAASAAPPASAEVHKLRSEIRRLELLVKKLQAELDAGREYCAALEAHLKTLQESD